MRTTIALVGSGPTALYCLRDLIGRPEPLQVTVFEREAVIGRGMPYSEEENSQSMLANIASIEIPPLTRTLVSWLEALSDDRLAELGIARGDIDERAFYPRLLLGAWFEDEARALVAEAQRRGHEVTFETRADVVDVVPAERGVTLKIEGADGENFYRSFDHAVLATGHEWPDPSNKPGFYPSPWPAERIARIPASRVGVMGSSLSAIDVATEVARAHGLFLHDEAGDLRYRQGDRVSGLSITLLSRKGVLPEADFYCPLPAESSPNFSMDKLAMLRAEGRQGLLDRAFDLFFATLLEADPDYVAGLGLIEPTPESFAEAYFRERETADPVSHAARNLAEARMNREARLTVPWRYTILRMHENFGSLVPDLSPDDQARFGSTLKTVFADNYATVPHEAIERLLALFEAGILHVEALGSDYKLDRENVDQGAKFVLEDRELLFDHLVDARGQRRLGLADLPFPTLRQHAAEAMGEDGAESRADLAVGPDFRLKLQAPLDDCIYCLALPYLIGRHPFAQGITASRDLGSAAARSILSKERSVALSLVEAEEGARPQLIIAA